MLDEVLHKHLDKMDALGEAVDRDIDNILSSLEIKPFMESPELALAGLVEMIKREVADKYIEQALKLGTQLANDIEDDGDIIVQDSNNPKLNADDKV